MVKKRSLSTNSGIVLATQVWSLFLAFFTTPYIVRTLGTDAYGVLSLTVVLTGYLSFLDLGFGWALIKYVAEFRAKSDHDAIKKSLETSLCVFVVLGFLASTILFLAAGWLAGQVFHIPKNLVPEAVRAIRLSAAGFLLTFLVMVYNSFFKGMQRFDFANITQSCFTTSYVLGTVVLLFFGQGIVAIVWLSLVLNAGALLAHLSLAHRLLPGIVSRPRFHKPYFKLIAGFSIFSMVSRLGMIALFQIDKFFVSYFLPISMLSYYFVAFNLSQKLNFMGSNIASVAMPLASEKFAAQEGQSFQQSYFRIAKVVWLLTLAPTLVVIIYADQILHFWISPEFSRQGAIPLIFLAAGFFSISAATLEAVAIDASGKPQVNAFFLAIAGTLSLVLCLLLTKYFAIIGTAMALSVSLVSLAVMVIIYAHRYVLRTAKSEYAAAVCFPFLKLILIAAPLLFLSKLLITGLAVLIGCAFLALAAILGLGYWTVFTAAEKVSLHAKISEFLHQVLELKTRTWLRFSKAMGERHVS